MHELIAAEIFDLDLVASMFTAAELQVGRDDDGDLVVQSPERDWLVVVSLEVERSMLVLRSYSDFVESSDELSRLRLCDRLNRETLLVRFYSDQETLLVADTMLSYEGGLSAFQVLRTYRWFLDICRVAITAFDEDDVVA